MIRIEHPDFTAPRTSLPPSTLAAPMVASVLSPADVRSAAPPPSPAALPIDTTAIAGSLSPGQLIDSAVQLLDQVAETKTISAGQRISLEGVRTVAERICERIDVVLQTTARRLRPSQKRSPRKRQK